MLCNDSAIICSHYIQQRPVGTPAMHILGFSYSHIPTLIEERSINCLMIGSGVLKKKKCAENDYDIRVGNY